MVDNSSLKIFENVLNSQICENISINQKLLLSLRQEYKTIRKIKEQFIYDSDNTFNLFRDLINRDNFDEKFYSKILAKILNPNTPDIGCPEYLNIFLNLLYKKNKNIKRHEFKDNIVVKPEDNFIDILIRDNKFAIIIENKIGNAVDQKDQLARYYIKVKNMGLIPIAIVYIPLNPYKKPMFKHYSSKYKNVIEEIEKIFIHLPAIHIDSSDKNDLAKGFLDQCVDYSKTINNIVSNVFIDQFSKLVKEKGGIETMANLSRKKIIEKIFSDYNLVEVANEIGELWNGKDPEKDGLFAEIFLEKLKEKINSIKPYKDDKFILLKEVNNINITIWSWDKAIGFSFSDMKNIPKEKKEKLIEVLEDSEFSEYFSEVEKDNKCIYKNFLYDEYRKSINEVVDFFKTKYEKLVEKVKKL